MSVALEALLLVVAAGAQDGGFDAAVRLVGEAQFSRAFAAAEAEPDALRRAQAEVHVLHHGGNLQGALVAALKGLESAPQDAWLLEQAAFVAVSVHEGPLALELGERLVAELERHGTGTDAAALERARGLRAEAASALATSEQRQSALKRARGVALALVLASLLAIAALMRTPTRG